MIVAKGFPEPIPAFEIKGIGGEYNLELEEVDPRPRRRLRRRSTYVPRDEGQERGGRRAVGPARQLSALGATLEARDDTRGVPEPQARLVGRRASSSTAISTRR